MLKVMMKLDGLTCPSCLTKIENTVANSANTGNIKVLFNAGKVKFDLEGTTNAVDNIKTNIEKLGYSVQAVKTKEITND